MFVHLSAILGFIVPLGNVAGPFIIWQIKKNEMPGIEAHGKDATNFQLTMCIGLVVSFILSFVGIGIFLMPIVGLVAAIFAIMAGLAARDGKAYRYPIMIQFIK